MIAASPECMACSDDDDNALCLRQCVYVWVWSRANHMMDKGGGEGQSPILHVPPLSYGGVLAT